MRKASRLQHTLQQSDAVPQHGTDQLSTVLIIFIMTLEFKTSHGSNSWASQTEEEALQDLEVKPNTEVLWFPSGARHIAETWPSKFRDDIRSVHNQIVDQANVRASGSTKPLRADVIWLMTDRWTRRFRGAILTYTRTDALSTAELEKRLRLSESAAAEQNLFNTGGLLTRLPSAQYWITGEASGKDEAGVFEGLSTMEQPVQPAEMSPVAADTNAWMATDWSQTQPAPGTDGVQPKPKSRTNRASMSRPPEQARRVQQPTVDHDVGTSNSSRKKLASLYYQVQGFFDCSEGYKEHPIGNTEPTLPEELASSNSQTGMNVLTFRRFTGTKSHFAQAVDTAFQHLALSRSTVTTDDEKYNEKFLLQLEEIILAGGPTTDRSLKVKMARRCAEREVHEWLSRVARNEDIHVMGARVTRFV